MALLLLIRHALTDSTGKRLSGTAPGIHLSPQGEAQAAHLAERMASVMLAGLYSSPLERCMETARPIAATRRIDVHPVPELIEVGYGRWTGRPLSQLARTRLWTRVQRAPSSVRFPGGETLFEVQRRSVAALEDIAVRHPRSAVALVTHADVIRLVLAHFTGIHIDLFQRLIVSPASVSAIVLSDGIPGVVRVNDTGTLEDLPRPRLPRATLPRPRTGAPRIGTC